MDTTRNPRTTRNSRPLERPIRASADQPDGRGDEEQGARAANRLRSDWNGWTDELQFTTSSPGEASQRSPLSIFPRAGLSRSAADRRSLNAEARSSCRGAAQSPCRRASCPPGTGQPSRGPPLAGVRPNAGLIRETSGQCGKWCKSQTTAAGSCHLERKSSGADTDDEPPSPGSRASSPPARSGFNQPRRRGPQRTSYPPARR